MIKDNLTKIENQLPKEVTLVAVSKFHPVENIQEAYAAGQRIFGESRPQELALKHELMPKDIQWHFIGHLQTNKVKLVAPFVSLVHSVDSLKLAIILGSEAVRLGRRIDVLLQIHIAQEEEKFGWDAAQLVKMLREGGLQKIDGINIVGLMGMATLTNNQEQIKAEFRGLKLLFDTVKSDYLPQITTLSMGMSGDWTQAIECGSNMVRIGSSIFGTRI